MNTLSTSVLQTSGNTNYTNWLNRRHRDINLEINIFLWKKQVNVALRSIEVILN